MAAAAVAASYSQLQQAPVGGAAGAVSGIGIGMQQPTKQKTKKKSQQERNTTTVDVESVAGYRGNDPVEQLVKYIENDVNGGGNSAAGQRKKERKKQNKLKKSNSLEELRTCSKMEVDDLKRQSATTEMMRHKKGTNNASSGGSSSTASGSSNSGKHNSASVADINKNCNKEQQQQSTPTVQVRNSNNPGTQQRKGERRSWGTEELQYLGDHQEISAAWSELETVGQKELPLALPALARMSELDALNTVLSETAEFHVVTKKKKPKKQRAVTMDDAAVAAAAVTGGNLQRMQQITKSASSNIMSQRMHYYTPYNSNNGGGSVNYKQQQQQSQQYQEHYQAPHGQRHRVGAGRQDADQEWRQIQVATRFPGAARCCYGSGCQWRCSQSGDGCQQPKYATILVQFHQLFAESQCNAAQQQQRCGVHQLAGAAGAGADTGLQHDHANSNSLHDQQCQQFCRQHLFHILLTASSAEIQERGARHQLQLQ